MLVLAGLVGAMAVATCAATIDSDRRATIRDSQQYCVVLTQVLEEHARRAFDISRASLADLSDGAMASGKPAVNADIVARMARWIDNVPQIASFWLYDASGQVVYTTQAIDTTGNNYSDREYFGYSANQVDGGVRASRA